MLSRYHDFETVTELSLLTKSHPYVLTLLHQRVRGADHAIGGWRTSIISNPESRKIHPLSRFPFIPFCPGQLSPTSYNIRPRSAAGSTCRVMLAVQVLARAQWLCEMDLQKDMNPSALTVQRKNETVAVNSGRKGSC